MSQGNRSLQREQRRAIVATPQQKLFDARRALKSAATLVRECASLGTMDEGTRAHLIVDAQCIDTLERLVPLRTRAITAHQIALRAKRSRRAA